MRLYFICLFIGISSALIAQEINIPSNLGDAINSRWNEIGPLISPDGKSMYYVREDHPDNHSSKKGSQDIWYSEMKADSTWSVGRRMGQPFNTHNFNSIESITPSGSTVIVRGNYKDGKKKGGIGFSLTRKTKYALTPLHSMKIKGLAKMSQGMYYGGFLSNDCKALLVYFSIYQGSPESNIFVCFIKEDGTWTRPRPLGTSINTQAYDESTPFLASDGVTMYFSSNRPGGYGLNDIYMTKRIDDTWQNWTEPVNMGSTINSSRFEAYYSIDARGEYAYMISEKGSFGKGDIIKVKLPQDVKPDPVVLLNGTIYNSKSNRKLNGKITYEILEDGGKEVGEAWTNIVTGKYQITLPYGHVYGFSAEIKGFMPISEHIDLTEKAGYQEITRDLLMTPIEVGQTVRLNNIFFESGKDILKEESFAELNRVLDIMKLNETMTIEVIGHTDSIGSAQTNIDLSQHRCGSVKAYLVEHEISEGRILATGKGEEFPLVSNKTDEGRNRNRRVEFVVLTK
ncbi:MAG: OmpA family protein [Flavobacteriales bacterium]|nr:OmpA family protein [Flavobacteriales bacterium]